MCIATGFDAIITTRAAMKIDHHCLTAIIQSILNNELEKTGLLELLTRLADHLAGL